MNPEAEKGPDPTARGSSLPQPGDLVALLGGHFSRAIGLDLTDPDDPTLGRWLLATALGGGRHKESVTQAACEALLRAGLLDPEAVANASVPAIEEHLAAAEIPKPDAAARLLVRLSTGLVERYSGSLSGLASEADGLEELAGRLARLAPGFGRAGVVRYLTPLRGVWHAAADLPATPAVCAAAHDLGWAGNRQDAEGTPALLVRELARSVERNATRHAAEPESNPNDATPSHPSRPRSDEQPELSPADLEAALERLGRAACLRGLAERCPLGQACPRRNSTAADEALPPAT